MSETNKKLYIKSFRISGFRSYADSKVVSLSPFSNVVVGPNGSGKSNFFAALEFVLGEREFADLSHEQRQELLHEGDATESVQTAFVEVVFDNSEGRLQVDTDEVVLRRSVGLKKDEFFINGKHMPKKDISTLLESAGFSRSNPYYICRQGKVSELCTMSDAQRLALLKEVAGTNVYDSRRADSQKLLEETEQKSAKIDESIASISSRLAELEQEKQELEEFRALDRERRALEYLLSDGEVAASQSRIEELEREKQEEMANAQRLSQGVDKAQEAVEQGERELSFCQSECARLEAEQRELEQRTSAVAKSRTRRELDLRDAQERVRVREDRAEASKRELALVEQEIVRVNNELEGGLKQALEAAKLAHAHATQARKRKEQREAELRAKQGRNDRFGADLEQRNAWLDEEIAALRANIAAKLQAEQEQTAQMESMQRELDERGEKLEELRRASEQNELDMEQAALSAGKQRELRDASNAKRKELWKRAQAQEDETRAREEDVKRAQQAMSEIVPFAFASGLRALGSICSERGLNYDAQVFGPLYSLISCTNAAYRTAVEVAAGNQLLHVVVDSDATAAQLMQGLVEKRAGRVTFKPLNVLTQREQQQQRQARSRQTSAMEEDEDLDDEQGGGGGGSTARDIAQLKQLLAQDRDIQQDDAFPLIDKVVFAQEIGPAVRAMLGRTLVCRNHRVASVCSKKYNVDCVTLDGDQVSRRGALSGGYVDVKRNRLAASEEVAKAQRALDAVAQAAAATKQAAREEDQRATQCAGEIDKCEQTRKHLVAARHNLAQEITRALRAAEQAKERLDLMREGGSTTAAVAQARAELELLIAEKEEEKLLPVSALGAEERAELSTIPAQLAAAREEEEHCATAQDELRAKVVALRSELTENLLRRRDELQLVLSDEGGAGGVMSAGELEAANAELEAAKREEQDLKQELEAVELRLAAKREALAKLDLELSKNRELEAKTSAKLDQADALVESILRKHDEYVLRKERASRKIREVGNLPQAELDKFRGTEQVLSTRLAQTNLKLKKFSSVNKRALDQFVSFSEQRQALVARQGETKDADLKIRDLIAHLDRAKEEAIQLTFKQVAHNFRKIFTELVPGGVAQLIMVKGTASSQEDDDEDDEGRDEENAGSVSSFVGVSPRVSFTGSDTVPMKQLSGGQKALVALTIMFAIQRSDQAPFYLFDEIDQALDSSHRTAVAALIQSQARSKTRSAQFIITTFRPEMVQVADRCFGIHFAQKVSSIGLIDREQALNFIRTSESAAAVGDKEEEDEEADATKNSSTSSRKRTRRRAEEEEEA